MIDQLRNLCGFLSKASAPGNIVHRFKQDDKVWFYDVRTSTWDKATIVFTRVGNNYDIRTETGKRQLKNGRSLRPR